MDFDGSLFAVNEYPERFFSLVLRSLELHGPHINNTLRKLRLFFREDRPPVLYDNFPNILQTLLCFALNNKCIELDLNLNVTCPNLDKPWWDFSNYILDIQKVIFIPLFTSRYLTTLKLKGFNFVIPPLPEPTDETESEQVLVIACPALRNLLLSNCKGLRNVKVLSRELDEVEIECCNGMRKVSIHTSFLGCFKFVGGQPGLFFNVPAQTCDIDLSGCEQLNFVSLDTLKVSTQFIQQTQAQVLYLLRCQMPRKVIIYNPHIKIMEMRISQMNMESFVLNAPNLEFLEYRSSGQRLKFDISACLALKVLIFRGAAFTDAWVNKLIPKFKCLERLELSQCHSLEKIDLKHQNLQAFTLHACFQLKEAVVDGRNLLNFTYSGNLRVYPMLVTSAKCSAQIEFLEQPNRPESWFSILRRFLCQFDHFKCITVSCASVEDLIFPREFVRAHVSPLHDVRLMNVKMREKPSAQTLIQLVESVLWLLPKPEALTFEHGFTKTRGILKVRMYVSLNYINIYLIIKLRMNECSLSMQEKFAQKRRWRIM